MGEICVRGFMVMKGYRGDAGATAAMIDSDKWLHTGDIGYYDEEGFFFVVDRLKELIKYKGMQIAPSELEHLLLAHPEVAESAVIGVPDEEAGELAKAFVVKRPGSTLTESDLIKFVNGIYSRCLQDNESILTFISYSADQVASYKKLRGGVVFIDVIPKLLSGKILRRELRALSSKL